VNARLCRLVHIFRFSDGDLISFGGAGKQEIGAISADVTTKTDLNYRFTINRKSTTFVLHHIIVVYV
jgi:hypothetical protein